MPNSTISTEKTTENHPDNKVLAKDYQPSRNFFLSDQILQHFIAREMSDEGLTYMHPKWTKLGEQAATIMDELSHLADKNEPTLVKRNMWGDTLNEIRFHPAYEMLKKIAVDSEMFRVKWQPSLRQKYLQEVHRLGFVSSFLYNMSEGGIPCPLCMTDGVARLIDRYCTPEDKERLLPHIFTEAVEELYTGAMFLTEKRGGSDVGANLVSATPIEGDYYALNGEKWFCSNANAEIIFVLARTNPELKGTKGLSIFLVEKTKPDGSRNHMDVVRLKEKLGVRSMASAECILQDTWGKLVGEEGQGFKIMTDMINLSRLYNAIASLSEMRRGLIEAYTFLKHRLSFGKPALEHALVRDKLNELGSIYVACFYLTWHAIKLLDKADNGDEQAAEVLRLVTPMVKREAALAGVYVIRESMELMGGLGYIEDTVMPKLMRDTMVLPIWEGAGNIMLLDMLRASVKSNGFELVCKEISNNISDPVLLNELQNILQVGKNIFHKPQEVIEATSKPLFEKLTLLYQLNLLEQYKDETSSSWIDPALSYYRKKIETGNKLEIQHPVNLATVDQLIAWKL